MRERGKSMRRGLLRETHTRQKHAAQLAWKETSSWKVKAAALKENELDSNTTHIWLFLCVEESTMLRGVDNKAKRFRNIPTSACAWKMNTSFMS